LADTTEKLRADLAVIRHRLADPADEIYKWLIEVDSAHCTLGIADLIAEETLILLELRKRGEA